MTHIFNAERGFKDEFLDGLTSAYARFLRPIPGASGVMSVSAPANNRVSVLIGGGSGHYPAFAGLVGPGLCDGAIVGDIFTSPSAEQAYRCIRALDGGRGVLLAFGNYSGDVMHFGLAVARAKAEGIDVRTVLVTDDVASAPPDRASARRGIAGGFFVFRAAAAAAHEGLTMDAVEEIARRANRATVTFGVAFGGCTFPGRPEPLFRVAPGTIEMGLGIHGEPGVGTIDWIPARELADVLVDHLIVERPPGATRARVLLNGLGATKYEELFVLYASIRDRVIREGIEIIEPEVGEFVTSLDMAGCSLSLCWLDDDLERLLAAPSVAPGFRSGRLEAPDPKRIPPPVPDAGQGASPKGGVGLQPTVARTQEAEVVSSAFRAMLAAIGEMQVHLGRLDSVAGDGDHGAGMVRGMSAAAVAADHAGPTASDVLTAAAIAFSDAAGGASGALWGSGLLAFGQALIGRSGARSSKAVEPRFNIETIHGALVASLDAVRELGGAAVGDKTMVDALEPFVDAFGAADESSVAGAWIDAAQVATRAAAATSVLVAAKGRAAIHGDRGKGTPDAGAVSLAAALTAAGQALQAGCALPAP